eukprot:CAMPEP_0194251084 /NCGR_PEP_ID=MMETSP0158-20130606/24574_1 /TAXON_ID=33649 /ORGANISM="Thalassionema nitzschioides, Strain L26-B" /LENGTH=183 /DNA_ID=CAMNT_0038988103 /DNA_START=40 /DNA_END=588 /DNA_ORIENTATION=+
MNHKKILLRRVAFPRCRRLFANNINVEGTIPRYGKGVEAGQYAQVERVFSKNDVGAFGKLVGDQNPIHTNDFSQLPDDFQPLLQHSGLASRPVVHGMLAASLFSCIFGSLIPGSVYRKQQLAFSNPIFIDDNVLAKVIVRKVKHLRGGNGILLTCDTQVLLKENHKICILGDAVVWLPMTKEK